MLYNNAPLLHTHNVLQYFANIEKYPSDNIKWLNMDIIEKDDCDELNITHLEVSTSNRITIM